MTNFEALKAGIAYPITDSQAELALTDRGLATADTYAGVTMEFELAKADILILLATSPNISEGGYSISISQKEIMLSTASGIYDKHGVENPVSKKLRDASNRW